MVEGYSSDRGILKSDDPVIDKLLKQPLEYFIEIYACKY